ncbi:MAG: hypothetical protein KDA41_01335, partial [Planctomycetales bacterium]|nr:hypothetical protein [Planctomycetales bacterium]
MSFLVLILAIAGVVWGAVLALRGSPLLGCAVYLIVASCFSGYYWSVDAVGLTWSIDRFFMMFLLIAAVLQWRVGKCDVKGLTAADLLLGAFLALVLLRMFTSDWRTVGPDQDSTLIHFVNGYGIPLALLLVARHARLDQRALRGVYVALACFGVYLAVTAVAEGVHAWGFVFPKYIANPLLGT